MFSHTFYHENVSQKKPNLNLQVPLFRHLTITINADLDSQYMLFGQHTKFQSLYVKSPLKLYVRSS